MIKSPTTLILGAGASAHIGYPLGSQLVSEICSLRDSAKLEIIIGNTWKLEQATEFILRLSRSGHYSIDAFLETNPDLLDIGKVFIAQQLKAFESEDRLFPPYNSGWYQHLFNVLVDEGIEHFRSNRITIITFNYDRSLECYLHLALQNRFLITSDMATELMGTLPIIHLHGMLGEYPRFEYNPYFTHEDLLEISRNIKIIHELDNDMDYFCSLEFSKSNSLLIESKNVYFLGFGFHENNINRFRFFNYNNFRERIIYATAYGIHEMARKSLLKRISKYGFTADNVAPTDISCNNYFNSAVFLE